MDLNTTHMDRVKAIRVQYPVFFVLGMKWEILYMTDIRIPREGVVL